MSPLHSFSTGMGAGKRRSHVPPIPATNFPVQASARRGAGATAALSLPAAPGSQRSSALPV